VRGGFPFIRPLVQSPSCRPLGRDPVASFPSPCSVSQCATCGRRTLLYPLIGWKIHWLASHHLTGVLAPAMASVRFTRQSEFRRAIAIRTSVSPAAQFPCCPPTAAHFLRAAWPIGVGVLSALVLVAGHARCSDGARTQCSALPPSVWLPTQDGGRATAVKLPVIHAKPLMQIITVRWEQFSQCVAGHFTMNLKTPPPPSKNLTGGRASSSAPLHDCSQNRASKGFSDSRQSILWAGDRLSSSGVFAPFPATLPCLECRAQRFNYTTPAI
jgi:hypothetical protein